MDKILVLVFMIFSGIISAQPPQLAGTYSLELVHTEENHINYELQLRPDGRFEFHAYLLRKASDPRAEHHYGKGSWEVTTKDRFSTTYYEVAFTSDDELIPELSSFLDFTGTVARLMPPKSRNPGVEPSPPFLRFLKSGVFWIEGVDLYRN